MLLNSRWMMMQMTMKLMNLSKMKSSRPFCFLEMKFGAILARKKSSQIMEFSFSTNFTSNASKWLTQAMTFQI